MRVKQLITQELHDEREKDQVQSMTRRLQYIIYLETTAHFYNTFECIAAN